jgi:hypothetical protein
MTFRDPSSWTPISPSDKHEIKISGALKDGDEIFFDGRWVQIRSVQRDFPSGVVRFKLAGGEDWVVMHGCIPFSVRVNVVTKDEEDEEKED